MSARQELNAYLRVLHRRLRIGTVTRGAAIAAAVALFATIALVLLLEAVLFAARSTAVARLALLGAVLVVAILGIWIPLHRLTRKRAATTAEAWHPGFQQRLLTFLERDTADPFLELLAADTLEVARGATPPPLATDVRVFIWLGAAALCTGTLIWLIAAAPGTIGYGSHLLWTNAARGAAPVYGIRVTPGDATIRRYTDQRVDARPEGIREQHFFLMAHYQSSAKWERIAMQTRVDQPGYQFTLTGVPENVEYYVEAAGTRSQHFTLRVADPPVVKQIRVTYHFPGWTGRADQTEEAGGDLRALKGTQAQIELTTDRPMDHGMLVLNGGQPIVLSAGDGNHYTGLVDMQQDGDYHVASLDGGQQVRLSEDYFIEARDPNPPSVSIARPGGDYRASPIEEVSVAVHASDEFGLQHLELRYAVNGGAEHVVALLPHSGAKQADGRSLLALENFNLVPGDVVSLYATAADAQLTSHTDMSFIQIEPFMREFSQSQAAGGSGGGGAGNESGEISQREKEIIAATFKQLNDKNATDQQAAETAKFLADVQTTLRQQSLALAGRLRSRELTDANSEFGRFQLEMREAANAMSPSAEQLRGQKWQSAIPEEQKVLQHLLRAEATFREIEIASGSRGGGGAGAGRDLASLFDLELDTEKNQYETQQRASSADQRANDINDTVKKLDELAHRQEELAQRQRDAGVDGAEQRWQQEMLQREAEQLQQQLEQLAQVSRRKGQSAGGDSQGQGAANGTSGSQQEQTTQQALDRLQQAQQDMQRAAANNDSAADRRRAADHLREASATLGGLRSQQAARRLAYITREAQRLAAAEAEQSERIKRVKERAAGSAQIPRDLEKLREDRQHLADSLSGLQQNMRNAARELEPGQRAAAEKMRGALKEADDADLEPLIQRTADWLRSGIDPNTRDTESQIAAGLKRLSEQTRDVQQALHIGGDEPGQGTQEALDRVARLRQQIEALGAGRGNPGAAAGAQSKNTQPGAGGREGFVANNIDTGNNARNGPRGAAPSVGAAPGSDTQKQIEQGLGELRALQRQANDDPAAKRQIQQMIGAMEHLDLKRFPGNPYMVEQIHQQLLADVDTLELQLRQGGGQLGQIRSPDPVLVPRGYEEAVADYFRRLSNGESGK